MLSARRAIPLPLNHRPSATFVPVTPHTTILFSMLSFSSLATFLQRCSRPLRCGLILSLAPGLPAIASAQVAATGTIEGRVLNATSGNYLNNARVTVAGTSREIFTDTYGFYSVRGVPVGEVTLNVSYPGLTPLQQTVTVPAGQTVVHDFNLVAL